MALQDMINAFQSILTRDDCSAAQAQTLILQGISRIQRTCRLPSMERTLIVPATSTASLSWFPCPADLLQPIDVLVPDWQGLYYPLSKVSYRELIRIAAPVNAYPKVYARNQTQIWIAPPLQAGSQLQFLYYGNFTPFASLTSENELSASTPDLGVYAGLTYAGAFFEHPLAQTWEQIFQAIKTETETMAFDLDANGGPQVIQPLYGAEQEFDYR